MTEKEQQEFIKNVNQEIDKVDALLSEWQKNDFTYTPKQQEDLQKYASLVEGLVKNYNLDSFKKEPDPKLSIHKWCSIADKALRAILSDPKIQDLPPDEMEKIAHKAIDEPIDKMEKADYRYTGGRTYGYQKSRSGDEHPAVVNNKLAETILESATKKREINNTTDELNSMTISQNQGKIPTISSPKPHRPKEDKKKPNRKPRPKGM